MGSSLPKVARIDLELEGDVEAPTVRPAPPWTPTLRETPTRQSLEAVRLAEEETRIAKADVLAEYVSKSRFPQPLSDDEAVTKVVKLSLVPPSAQHPPSASGVASHDDCVAAMRELYAQGDAEAALVLATVVASELAEDPAEDPYGGLIPVEDDPFGGLELVEGDAGDAFQHEDHTAIVEASSSSRLRAMTSRQVPRLLVGPKELSKLPMDPRAAFIMGHIDGRQTMEEILDVCAMPESEALELIERLRLLGAIALD